MTVNPPVSMIPHRDPDILLTYLQDVRHCLLAPRQHVLLDRRLFRQDTEDPIEEKGEIFLTVLHSQ